jgi:hypothetical protein
MRLRARVPCAIGNAKGVHQCPTQRSLQWRAGWRCRSFARSSSLRERLRAPAQSSSDSPSSDRGAGAPASADALGTGLFGGRAVPASALCASAIGAESSELGGGVPVAPAELAPGFAPPFEAVPAAPTFVWPLTLRLYALMALAGVGTFESSEPEQPPTNPINRMATQLPQIGSALVRKRCIRCFLSCSVASFAARRWFLVPTPAKGRQLSVAAALVPCCSASGAIKPCAAAARGRAQQGHRAAEGVGGLRRLLQPASAERRCWSWQRAPSSSRQRGLR